MIILCDIDNVVCDTTAAILTQYNEEYNDNLTIDDIKTYWMERYVKPEAKEKFYEFFLKKETWKRVKPIEENIKGIQWLIDNGHDVYFVTATWSDNLKKKSNFLKRCFKNIDVEDKLIKSNHKELILGSVIIDDYTRNIIMSKCPTKVCIKYPWNEDYEKYYDGDRWSSVIEWVNDEFNAGI